MSTSAQTAANQANAQHSTGPKTEQGKAASSLNNFRHGLAGVQFSVSPGENEEEYKTLLTGLYEEHQPATFTEKILVEKMAQHFWLSQRAHASPIFHWKTKSSSPYFSVIRQPTTGPSTNASISF